MKGTNMKYLTDEQLAAQVSAANAEQTMNTNEQPQSQQIDNTERNIQAPVEPKQNTVSNDTYSNEISSRPNLDVGRPKQVWQLGEPKQLEAPKEEPISKDLEFPTEATTSTTPQGDITLTEALAPLKVKGRDFTVASMKDLRLLAQRGVDYTQKAQELAADRKYLRVLQDNGLMDFNKLSFAVDLINKKPGALAKFFKDNNIDPIDVDISQAREYAPSNVGGDPVRERFEMVVDTIKTDQNGEEFLSDLNARMGNDTESAKQLIDNPRILANMFNARRNGLYNKITSVMDREDLYDPISSSEPFVSRFARIGTQIIETEKKLRAQQEAAARAQAVPQINQPNYSPMLFNGYNPPRIPIATGNGFVGNSSIDDTARRLAAHGQAVQNQAITPRYPQLTDAELSAAVKRVSAFQ